MRIEPEYFIEVFKGMLQDDGDFPLSFKSFKPYCYCSYIHPNPSIAIFLIKPQTTSLAERMEVRQLKSKITLLCDNIINQTQLK